MTSRFEVIKRDLHIWQDKCNAKDLLMRTLADLVVKELASEVSVTGLLRSLREVTVKPSHIKRKGMVDFNLENLCRYLEAVSTELNRSVAKKVNNYEDSLRTGLFTFIFRSKIPNRNRKISHL